MQCNAVRIIVFACTLIRFCSSSSYWSNPTIYTLVDSFPFKNKHPRAFVQPDWSRKTSKEGFPPLPQSRLPAISGGNPNQPCHPPLWSTELVQMFFFQISLRSSLLSGFPSPHSLWCEEKKKLLRSFMAAIIILQAPFWLKYSSLLGWDFCDPGESATLSILVH